MKLKTFFTLILSVFTFNAWAVDFDKPSLEDCRDNADLIGYMITIKAQCDLNIESDNNQLVETLNNLSKKCIAQYGESSMVNATRVGIFSAKGEMEETGRNATCYRALKEYPGLFD